MFKKSISCALVLCSFLAFKNEAAAYGFKNLEEFEELNSGTENLEILESYHTILESDSKSSCTFTNASPENRKAAFNRAVNKLRNINSLGDHIDLPGNKFALVNKDGKNVYREKLILGDYMKIIPPVDPLNRDYWVKVEKVVKTDKEFTVVVRPSSSGYNPTSGITDHFFTDRATNTFSITLKGSTLTARVHGVNEEINREQARSWEDGIANAAVARMVWGIYKDGKTKLGLQSMLWDSLTSNLAKCD